MRLSCATEVNVAEIARLMRARRCAMLAYALMLFSCRHTVFSLFAVAMICRARMARLSSCYRFILPPD